jgi:transketolase
VLRGSVPRLFDTPIKVGEMRELSGGDDVLVVTSGICTEEAMRATAAFAKAGLSIRHLHLHTIKPFDSKALLDHISSVKHGVVTLENHVTEGGIGSLVAETMADAGVGKRLVRLGLKDTYAHGGSRPYLMQYYGLDASAMVRGIEDLMGQKFGISEDDLAAARFDDVHSLVKAEAL